MNIPNTLLTAIEAKVNSEFAKSSQACALLSKAQGKLIAVKVQGIGANIYIFIHEQSIRLANYTEKSPDTELSASPLHLARSLQSRGFSNEVTIVGDTHALHTLQKAILACDKSTASIIAPHLGDDVAYLIGHSFNKGLSWLNRHKHTLEIAISDYIQEEVKHAPTRIELDNFVSDIDNLRLQADRLTARLSKITSQDSTTEII